ncbi:MAG: hypothetical protein IPK72_20650 [Candidatus Eisenbacteria bacterium]|nr:hypothetical protein [Candidatus Eisenbacteria bacterium]
MSVEMIQVGDQVLSYDEEAAQLRGGEVVRVHAPYKVGHYLIINDRLRVTENHPILVRGAWTGAGDLRPGDMLTAADGTDEIVRTIRRVNQPTYVYNFQVSTGTYVAAGLIVHNKEDCEEYTQYCPTCGD